MSDYRIEMQRHLRQFAQMLYGWEKVERVNDLEAFTFDRNNNEWEFENKSSGIIFKNFDRDIYFIPKFEDFNEIPNPKIRVSFEKCNGIVENSDIYDTFKELNINIEIEISNWDLDAEGEWLPPLKAAWHFDKNMAHFNDNKSFIHPEYHLHFGGMRMKHSFEQDNVIPTYEGILLLDAPRLMHPPMDPILVIDFIIKNFYSYNTHYDITSKKQYQDIIKAAQNRFWKPYYLAIAKHWTNIGESFESIDWADNEKKLSVSYIPFLNPAIQDMLNSED